MRMSPSKSLWVLIFLAGALSACSGPRALNTVTANPDRGTEITRDLAYGDHPRQRFDIYEPDRDGPHPVLIYIHGGGWERGSKGEYAFVGKRFAAEGYLTAMINYRLTPEGVWPVFMEDVAAAVAQVQRVAAEYGGDTDRLFLAGHSAGGYNAVMLALAPEFLAKEGVSTDTIKGAVGISGVYDFDTPSRFAAINAAFGQVDDLAVTKPINRARSDAPPLLLLHGDEDESTEVEDARLLAANLAKAGAPYELKVYPGADHAATVVYIAWPTRGDTVNDMIAFFETLD